MRAPPRPGLVVMGVKAVENSIQVVLQSLTTSSVATAKQKDASTKLAELIRSHGLSNIGEKK